MIAMRHSPITEGLAVEIRAVARSQGEIAGMLRDLVKLSAAQLNSPDDSEWSLILQQKQELLDRIEASKPGALFERSWQLEESLFGGQYTELAEQLRKAREGNRDLFSEVAALEQQARETLEEQMRMVCASMSTTSRRRRMHRTYQDTVGNRQASRFLDGIQ